MAITIEDLRPMSYNDIGEILLPFDYCEITIKKDKLLLGLECDAMDDEGRWLGRCYNVSYNSENLKILEDLRDVCEYIYDDYVMIDFKQDPFKLIPIISDRFDNVAVEYIYSTDLNSMAISSIDELASKFKYFEIKGNNSKTKLSCRLQSENYDCDNHGLILDIHGNSIDMFLTCTQNENVDKLVVMLEKFCNYICQTFEIDHNYNIESIKGGKMFSLHFEPNLDIDQNYNFDTDTFRGYIIQLNNFFNNITVTKLDLFHCVNS